MSTEQEEDQHQQEQSHLHNFEDEFSDYIERRFDTGVDHRLPAFIDDEEEEAKRYGGDSNSASMYGPEGDSSQQSN